MRCAPIAVAAAAAMALAPAAGLAQSPYEAEKEAALGRGLAADLRRQFPPIEDATLTGYLARLAARLNNPPQTGFPLDIVVTRDTQEREVTALPGGHLFVSAGALAAATSESALAGLLAHGLAHLGLGHLRPARMGAGTIPLLIFQHGSNLLVPVSFAPQYRAREVEADRRAGELLHRAGFDPQAYADSVAQLKPRQTNDPGEQQRAIRAAASPATVYQTGEFPALRERIAAIVTQLSAIGPPPTLRRAGER